jgi:hypothetical protein
LKVKISIKNILKIESQNNKSINIFEENSENPPDPLLHAEKLLPKNLYLGKRELVYREISLN